MNEEQLELIIDLLQREKASTQEALDYEPKPIKWKDVNQEHWTREDFDEWKVEGEEIIREIRKDLDEKMKTIDATLKSIFRYMLTHGGEE